MSNSRLFKIPISIVITFIIVIFISSISAISVGIAQQKNTIANTIAKQTVAVGTFQNNSAISCVLVNSDNSESVREHFSIITADFVRNALINDGHLKVKEQEKEKSSNYIISGKIETLSANPQPLSPGGTLRVTPVECKIIVQIINPNSKETLSSKKFRGYDVSPIEVETDAQKIRLIEGVIESMVPDIAKWVTEEITKLNSDSTGNK
jgi:hypothetical protein